MATVKTLVTLRRVAKRMSFGGRLLLAQRLLRRYFISAEGVAPVDDFDGDLSIDLRLSEHMQSRMFWVDYYNRDIVALFDKQLQPGMVVVDVGANIGEITLVAAKRIGVTGRVIAFEPVDAIAQVLEENIRRNAFDNVTVVRAGLADTCGSAPIFASYGQSDTGKENHGLGSLYGGVDDGPALQTIRLTTLDAYFQEHPIHRLDLIKIDIEGAELPCLRGAAGTIERFKPLVIIEIQAQSATAAGYRQADILDYLTQFGYAFHKIGRNGQLRAVSAASLADYQNVLCVPGSINEAPVTVGS